MPAPITHLNVFSRDASSWPKHRKDKKARHRERKTVARKAQQERENKLFLNPSR